MSIGTLPVIGHVLQYLLVVVVSFALITLVASVIRFQLVAERVKSASPEHLNPADAFQLQIIQRLGVVQREPEPISVLFISPHDAEGIAEKHGPDAGKEVMDQLEQHIRAHIRKKDFFMRYDEKTFGAVTNTARRHAQTMAERLINRIGSKTCRCANHLTLRVPINIGYATYPENTNRAALLTSKAREALDESLSDGPGRHRAAAVPDERPETQEQAGEQDVVKEEAQKGIVDELTGVLREEKLASGLQKYVARYRKDDLPVSVLYLSIDYVTQYREHYGPEAVNAILKGLGTLLIAHTRESDLISRYSDTHFILAMDCAPGDALTAAQRLSTLIKRTPFALGRTPLKISVSVGVAGFPEHGSSARDLFQRAEFALQQAQEMGRNLCIVYRPEMKKSRPDIHPSRKPF